MLKPSLQLRIGQQLTMTPQLQQAIRLLQLPSLDLQAHVRETLGICDRAYIVSQGTVLASGSADHILANPQVREVYLGQDFKL